MKKRPTEISNPKDTPSEVVEMKIRDAAMEPYKDAIAKGYQGFRNRWNDGEIDIPGISKRLTPEEAAIAITGKAQEQRNEARKIAFALLKENQKLMKENTLLKRRLARYEKKQEADK